MATAAEEPTHQHFKRECQNMTQAQQRVEERDPGGHAGWLLERVDWVLPILVVALNRRVFVEAVDT